MEVVSAQHTILLLVCLGLLLSFAQSGDIKLSRNSLALGLTKEYTVQGNGTVTKSIICKHVAHSANIATVTELSLLTTVPCDAVDEYHTLASIDIWSEGPALILTTSEESVLNVFGSINPPDTLNSYLSVSWDSAAGQSGCSYRCQLKGIDKDGHPVSTTRTTSERRGESYEGSTQRIEQKVQVMGKTLQNVTSVVRDIDRKIDENSCDELIKALENKVNTVNENVDSLRRKVEDLSAFMIRYNPWLPALFDFSGVHSETIYLATKAVAAFDIDAADQLCRAVGGYLVELNDDKEFIFVRDFIINAGGTTHFFTGYNDNDVEGTFVHKRSGQPLTIKKWSKNQPDDSRGKEDCLEIRLDYGDGLLNDAPCDYKGKYVCEMPFQLPV